MEIKEIKQKIWFDCNLSEANFFNSNIGINSNDIRSCNCLHELRAVSEFMVRHIQSIKANEKISKGYLFTQICLKDQIDWQIFKVRKHNKKMREQCN